MTNIAIAEWMDILKQEYLSTFVKDGGAAVKFSVIDDDRKWELLETLRSCCEKEGYIFLNLDAEEHRVHMPQKIFFGIAAQIDWRLLARQFMLRSLESLNYQIKDIDPGTVENVIDAVAQLNGLEHRSVLLGLRQKIEKEVTKNKNMVKAFRIAMTQICLEQADSSAAGRTTRQPVIDWLNGTDPRIGRVRTFQICTTINRATARYFLRSIFYWVQQAGWSGTVVMLDNARLTVARNPKDGQHYYNRAMTMDHYQLLREIIDDTDLLTGTLLIVRTNYQFFEQESGRDWGIYEALKVRIMDDVRDRNIVNPVSALVRLS